MVGTFGIRVAFERISGLPSKAEAVGGTTEKWLWPYVQLDTDKKAEIAYNEYYLFLARRSSAAFSSNLEKRLVNLTSHSPLMPLIYSNEAR
jgi:hypothetical protein